MSLKYSRFNIQVQIPDSEKSILFNTLNRSILLVNRELTHALQPGLSRMLPVPLTDREENALRQSGILIDEGFDEIAYFRYAAMKAKVGSSSLSLFVSFSSRCNFKCIYCYQDLRQSEQQSNLSEKNWETLFSYIADRVTHHGVTKVAVALFGGEPLMNYDVLYRAVRDLKGLEQTGASVVVSLITNGSLLRRKRSKELAPYVDYAQITLDGPREIHNKRRPYANGKGSFDRILMNIVDAIDSNLKIALRVNVDEENAPYVSDLLRDLKRQGLHQKLVNIDFKGIYSTQQTILAEGCAARIGEDVESHVAGSIQEAARLGYKVGKAFIFGPCLGCNANGFAVDEQLRVYRCPGFLYGEPDGVITSDSQLKITSSEWYRQVVFEPKCVESCVYGPICYGGCRWKAGGATKVNCNKDWLEKHLHEYLLAYASSNYDLSLPESG